MSEKLMGGGFADTPTGTPTERLVWVALWHHGTYYGLHLWGLDLQRHVGGSKRSLDAALSSLIKRGIVQECREDDGLTGHRLTLKYAQPRRPHKIDKPYEHRSKRRIDEVVSPEVLEQDAIARLEQCFGVPTRDEEML